MEQLDRDEEDEEVNTGARNQAISALLGSPTSRKPHQPNLMETEDQDTPDERPFKVGPHYSRAEADSLAIPLLRPRAFFV